MKGRPRNWRTHEEFWTAYEEGGEKLGRILMRDRSKEEYFWRTLGSLGLYPRWYLMAFMTVYKERHPNEAKAVKMREYRARRRLRESDG